MLGLIDDHDVIISAIYPAGRLTPNLFRKVNEKLIIALQFHPEKKSIIVGGAGSIKVAPGLKLTDTPIMEKFPKEWKTAIFVHGEVLESYKASGINWTYFSPVSQIYAGERTGKYKLGP